MLRVIFTEEEKELDRKETLKMLKDGIAQAEIARQLGRSAKYISNLKNDLIQKGLITQEEIDIARQRALEERQASRQRINNKEQEKQKRKNDIVKSLKEGKKTRKELEEQLEIPKATLARYIEELIQEKKINVEDVINEKERDREIAKTRNQNVLEDFNSGLYTIIEIAKKYHISSSLVSRIVKGKYEERIKPRPRKEKEVSINPDAILTEEEQEVIQWLKKGYQYSYIEKQLGISQNELLKIVNALKSKSAITAKQIKEAREQKKIRDEKEVIIYLERGFSQADILRQKEEFNNPYLSKMIARLKEQGRINEDTIERQDIDKINLEKLVLKGMLKGLTVKQIIESDETGYATESRVRRMKKQLISSGQISKKLFEKQHSKARNSTKELKYKELDKKIYNLISRGAKASEIANCLNLGICFVYGRQKIILENKKITKEMREEFKRKRKEEFDTVKANVKMANCEGGIVGSARRKFFELTKAEISYGNILEKEDIQILARCLILDYDVVTKENLRFVIMQYIGLEDYNTVKKLVHTLLMLYGDTEYGDALRGLDKYAKEKAAMYRIKELEEQDANR